MHTKQEWFENWFDSPYYPVLYNNRDEQEAANFVDHLVAYLQLNEKAVVADMACGEGRHSHQLSKTVGKVMGFDLSKSRIENAKLRYASDKVSFYEHDMRTPFYVNFFDVIFNFFTSFGYFDTQRDHKNAAQSLANALKKDGILVIDYFNNAVVKKNLVQSEQKTNNGITFNISKAIVENKIVKNIDFITENGEHLHYQERVSDVSIDAFKALFESVGLQLEASFGDYNLRPFDVEASPRLIMIFRK